MSRTNDDDFGCEGYWTPPFSAEQQGYLEIDRCDGDLIVEPLSDVGELDHWRLDAELDRVLEMFDWTDSRRLVFDLSSIPWSVSAAVTLFVALSKRSGLSRGTIRFRGLSKLQEDALATGGLRTLWPIETAENVPDESGSHRIVTCPC